MNNVCNPTIGFFNSKIGDESFAPIYMSGWGGVITGEISFENDSEFVLVKHMNFDGNTTQKSYYKLTKMPE